MGVGAGYLTLSDEQGLVVAVAVNSMWPLVFFHVAFGAGWTIVDLLVGLVIGPIIGSLTVPARIEFTVKFMPKMVVLMPTIVTATLVAGWQLSTKMGTNLTSYYHHGWVVASFIVVGIMGIIALGLQFKGIAIIPHRFHEVFLTFLSPAVQHKGLHVIRLVLQEYVQAL